MVSDIQRHDRWSEARKFRPYFANFAQTSGKLRYISRSAASPSEKIRQRTRGKLHVVFPPNFLRGVFFRQIGGHTSPVIHLSLCVWNVISFINHVTCPRLRSTPYYSFATLFFQFGPLPRWRWSITFDNFNFISQLLFINKYMVRIYNKENKLLCTHRCILYNMTFIFLFSAVRVMCMCMFRVRAVKRFQLVQLKRLYFLLCVFKIWTVFQTQIKRQLLTYSYVKMYL